MRQDGSLTAELPDPPGISGPRFVPLAVQRPDHLGHQRVLLRRTRMHYDPAMTNPAPLIEDDEAEAEARALAAAIAESDADPRTAPHEEVRAWLLRLAQVEFDAPAPEPR
jgi:hypothetical protein